LRHHAQPEGGLTEESIIDVPVAKDLLDIRAAEQAVQHGQPAAPATP